MRKINTLAFLLFVTFSFSYAIQDRIPLATSSSKQELVVTNRSFTEINLRNTISSIILMDVSTKGGDFVEMFSTGYYKNNELGAPQLPTMNKLIEIPQGATADISILSYDEEIIDLSDYGFVNQILPAQASLSKSDDPNNVEFLKDQSIYNSSLYEKETAIIQYIGEARGLRIGRLEINPFSYNPQTNQLIIKNNISLNIRFKNADLLLTKSKKQQHYSPAFSSLFNNILSVQQAPTRDGIVTYGPVKYIMVADRMFETALAPFIEWKTKKGFNVIVAYTDQPEVGTTTTSIKSYLQGQYDNPSDGVAPSYVLFVGDVPQIPVWNSQNSGSSDHITDLYYCDFTGDYLPEVYYGRFSANNVAELTPQINKTIEYERFEMPDPSYLNDVVLVAGVDGTFAPKHGNGQINYGTNEYFNTAHGFTNIHTYLYGSGSPITSDNSAAAAAIHQNVSDGAGFVNYTAHCDWDGWADPSFNVTDVPNLTNNGKYSLMIGNCCLSNKFDTPNNGGTCFGEAMMRAENAGVIGYIGGSNSTLWDEDFYWGVGVDQIGITEANANSHTYENTGLGAYDGSFHENGEAESDWYVSSSQLLYRGNLSVTEGGSSNILYYWEIYHLMGDPSLMAYFTVPDPIVATYTNSVPVGTSSLTVNTDAPGSYIAISKDGILLDAQLADANGNITLNFTAFGSTGTADIVVTKQNRAPYIGTLTIIVGTEPPVADFVADNTTIFEGQSIAFTDLTTQGPSEWAWDFGDGSATSTSTEQNPSHTYLTAGNYTVSLTATNNIDSDDEIKVAYITVNELTEVPNVDFVANQTSVSVAEDIVFTDLTTLLPESWSWDFGDGSNSTEQNPTHAYAASGFYTVSLTAYNSVGPNTETKIDYIEVVLDPYCDASSNSTSYENITNVTFGSINNNSGSDGYADYTSLSTDINIGETYSFSVSYDKNYNSDEVYTWIDWNANHIFEESEKYLVAQGSGSNSPYNFDIEVPSTATPGTTRMRVRLHDTNDTPNNTPCGDSGYGEVEDYSVNIIDINIGVNQRQSTNFNIYPNPAKQRININSDVKNYSYKIVALDGRVLINGTVESEKTSTINISNLSAGIYSIVLEFKDGLKTKKIIIK